MTSLSKSLFLAGSLILISATAHAKVFKNAYLSFELPERWDCQIQGTEWSCRSTISATAKEAIIILTAKEVGPSDTLQQYESYLKTVKTVPGPGGKPMRSEVKQVKTRKIAGHDWVDALHMSSETPGYYTRYLATVKSRLAILVTFSAHKRYYTKYSNDFFKAIESLRVIVSPDLFQSRHLAPDRGAGEVIGGGGAVGGPMGVGEVEDPDELPDEPTEGSSKKEKMFAFGLLIAALGGYILLKSGRRRS